VPAFKEKRVEVHVKSKRIEKIGETPVLQQTAFWSEVKRKVGIGSKAFDIKVKAADLYTASDGHNYVVDDLLILFQEIGDDYRIGYVPYGPTMEPSEETQGVFLEELSESLRPHLPSKCVMLRYDLSWESLWAKDDSYFDDHGDWIGPPRKSNQEIRLNFNTQNWNLRKANTNILPPDTIFVDLRKDKNTLLKEMKAKTRYNVRLSSRKGVCVRKADFGDLDIWYELHKETCTRNKLCLHGIEHFEALLGTKVRGNMSPAQVELLIAEVDNFPLAAIFLVFSGQRATYLYGASSSKYRHYMASHALQWEAMKRAKHRGCMEYDMFGIAPNPDHSHPLHGLYRFKTGFGGKLFHTMGCWDYPLDPRNYQMYLTAEMKSDGFHA
jgi:lipid II:glycine glycyltransferase (peptidoglycan interpeptide bridge formation enzyme)